MSTHGQRTTGGWQTVRVTPSRDELRDDVAAALFAGGAEGLHDDAGTWVTHVPDDHDLVVLRAQVVRADPAARILVFALDPAALAHPLHGDVQAHEVGRFVIAPPWLAGAHDPARLIVVEPGMAFGTGEHPTTRGVLRLMDGVLRPGDVVADLGAGSAILAIAAAKGGASKVIAIELDAEAMGNAQENVERNGVADRVHLLTGDATVLMPFFAPVPLVLANIISTVLVELLPVVATSLAPGGHAIIAGILFDEREFMVGMLERTGWRVVAEDREAEWWSATIARA
ncbi:MAG: 50S ribosomal protein L11 methyltransferase [Gemmatimonadaceae bacterium]|nr:50S ribosomal protein L11 methyltransferase [Gemmatimonadaceae bacterium]